MKGRGRRIHLLVLAGAAVIGLLLALGTPASSGAGATAAKAKRVGVRDNTFTPRTVRVAVGGKVTWTWKGVGGHNVTFRALPEGASKRRAKTRSSGTFTRSFTKKGTYRYVCTIHEAGGMTGRVIAQ
jgi:plastocyanin